MLEDGGLMYRGVHNRIKPTPWNYAQYEKDILECALYLVREIGKVLYLFKVNEILLHYYSSSAGSTL